MFGAIREYKLQSGTDQELIRRIRDEFVPKIVRLPDLVSYTVVRVGADGLVTTSIFESEAGARESVKLAGDWVKNALQAFVVGTPRVTTGELTVRHVNEDVKASWGVMRRFSYVPRSATTIAARVREGLVPILGAIPGLATFGLLIASGPDLVGASLSAVADRTTAEAVNERSLAWVKENIGDLLTAPPEILFGEIKLRHTRTAVSAG
jgi:hypothetical protein